MPKKIQNCGKGQLIAVSLPAHGATYTVISHESVIDMSTLALSNAGFTIVDEEYRATADGQIAQGVYKLNYMGDPDLSMMFAWTNSYNKQVRFKCSIGAYINKTGTTMFCGDMGSWSRKHTGTADTETQDTIDEQVKNAYMYYNQLVHDKSQMEGIIMNKRKQAQMLGILFAEYQILTTEQASMIRQQMDKPTYVFTDSNSLWAFYNYVTVALQLSHPKTWMEDQRILHMFISEVNKFAPVAVVVPEVVEEVIVDPLENNYGQPENQTNLLVQIAEMEIADTQAVQEEVEIEPVVHQSEEIVLTEDELAHQLYGVDNDIEVSIAAPENEAEETPFDLDAEDDAMLDALLVPIEMEISPENLTDVFPQDETVIYTDPVGNTFEAPIVSKSEETFDLMFIEEEQEDENIPDFF